MGFGLPEVRVLGDSAGGRAVLSVCYDGAASALGRERLVPLTLKDCTKVQSRMRMV